ncbi:MAG: hypothetical protein U5O15_08290 [Candidatus Krumholzibacteriota bacterium]|nr:hypothetical protein [Candidatus Krumholzibacteriota bacterium]
MLEDLSINELNKFAKEFIGRLRANNNLKVVSNRYTDKELEIIAMSLLYSEMIENWDRIRPFENYARGSLYHKFTRELKGKDDLIGPKVLDFQDDKIDKSKTQMPNSLDMNIDTAYTRKLRAEELISELESAKREHQRGKRVLSRRRMYIEFGIGKKNWSGVYIGLGFDLHPDIYLKDDKTEAQRLAVLSRRNTFIKYGLSGENAEIETKE